MVDSLEAALWAFHRSRNFREGALLAVNLGDDADTTGAIYGQIAGAHYGVEAIPAKWRQRLTMTAEFTSMGRQPLRPRAPVNGGVGLRYDRVISTNSYRSESPRHVIHGVKQELLERPRRTGWAKAGVGMSVEQHSDRYARVAQRKVDDLSRAVTA